MFGVKFGTDSLVMAGREISVESLSITGIVAVPYGGAVLYARVPKLCT